MKRRAEGKERKGCDACKDSVLRHDKSTGPRGRQRTHGAGCRIYIAQACMLKAAATCTERCVRARACSLEGRPRTCSMSKSVAGLDAIASSSLVFACCNSGKNAFTRDNNDEGPIAIMFGLPMSITNFGAAHVNVFSGNRRMSDGWKKVGAAATEYTVYHKKKEKEKTTTKETKRCHIPGIPPAPSNSELLVLQRGRRRNRGWCRLARSVG